MKVLRFLPLAFFSGIHGFALFAPYAAVVLTAELVMRKYKPRPVDAMALPEPVIEEAFAASPV